MPINVIAPYLIEKQNQEIYKEDCLWIMAAANIEEKKRHQLVQPYMQNKIKLEVKNNAPYRTKEETLEFIFEGLT